MSLLSLDSAFCFFLSVQIFYFNLRIIRYLLLTSKEKNKTKKLPLKRNLITFEFLSACTFCSPFFFPLLCTSMVVVYGTPIRPYGQCQRPFQRPIRAAMTSLRQFHSALARGEFPTRDVRCLSGIRAARFPVMTSHAHRACSWRVRNVPETRSAHRTRGMQHVMPRTRAHVGTRVFQIHLTLAAILTVRAPESLHEGAHA